MPYEKRWIESKGKEMKEEMKTYQAKMNAQLEEMKD
jgi:hypothetical protein